MPCRRLVRRRRRILMKLIPRLFLLILSISTVLVLSEKARGCSCFEYGTPVCAAYWRADAVFVGYVKNIEQRPQQDGAFPMALLHLIVEQPLKGISSSEVEVETLWGTSCDIGFKKGERWLIYANRVENGDGLYAGACTLTTKLENADDALNYIRGLTQQTHQQSISGKLKQNGYDPVGGLRVTLEGVKDRFETTTNNEGDFEFSLPRSG